MNQATDPFVPMPDTHHPYFSDDEAATIRSAIVNGLHLIQWIDRRAMPTSAFAGELEPITATLPVLTLSVRKCGGGAPFVGDPYLNDAKYFWKVAVDDRGRHVAGEAVLTWRFDPTEPKRTHHRNLRTEQS